MLPGLSGLFGLSRLFDYLVYLVCLVGFVDFVVAFVSFILLDCPAKAQCLVLSSMAMRIDKVKNHPMPSYTS